MRRWFCLSRNQKVEAEEVKQFANERVAPFKKGREHTITYYKRRENDERTNFKNWNERWVLY